MSRPAGSAFDDGCEVDLSTDEAHCGAVGRACVATGGVAQASCEGGVCTSTCQLGYLNVSRPPGSAPDDGCDVELATNVDHCGAQERRCDDTNVATVACEGGLCTSSCAAGWANVSHPAGAAPDDGCELNVATDANNCGARGRECASTNVATLRCEGGLCTSRCEVGYGNLNRPAAGSADDGCEAACPSTPGAAQMVMLPEGYCIDQTEVTQGQYAAWLNGTPAPSTAGQDAWCTWNDSYVPTGDWGDAGRTNYPVTYVDWCDAYAYCEGVGKRMCGNREGGANGFNDSGNASESQWHNACVSGAAGVSARTPP